MKLGSGAWRGPACRRQNGTGSTAAGAGAAPLVLPLVPLESALVIAGAGER